MNISTFGFDREIIKTIERISKKFCFLNDSFNLDVIKTDENKLTVSLNGNNGVIETNEISSVLRGVAILSDKLKNNDNTSLTENKAFEKIGIMMDLSRNAVFKPETVEDILDRIAVMGLNSALLYMEDVYTLDDYPYFGYMRGRYTKEDLKAFDKYALSVGVELVPNIEALSHLECPLFWAPMSKVRECERTLLVDEPATYEFIDAMLQSISECFTTRRLFVGLDEAHELGRMKHLDKHGYERPYDIFIRHIHKVCDMVKKYDFKPIMADDMFHRMFGNGGYYQPNAVFPEDISETLPDNISMVYWDYYNEDSEFIGRCMKKSSELKRPMEVMGGIWTWSGSVNYDKTIKTTKGLIKACKKEGIKNITATLWGDDGAEVSIYAGLFGMQIYAESFYGYDVDDLEHSKEMFRVCTGYNADSFLALDLDQIECDPELRDRMPGYAIRANNLVKIATFQDILQGLFDYNFAKLDNMKDHFEKCTEILKNSESLKDLDYLREYAIMLSEMLAIKGDLGIRLKKAYDSKDRKALEIILSEIEKLIDLIEKIHYKFGEIWLKNNKAFGLDRSDLRFGGLRARTERAYMRLLYYLEGRIEKIEELEIERLSYNGSEKALIHTYSTSKIVSASQFR